MQQSPTEQKKSSQKFPVARVKKIIQENSEIGKINNVVPHLATKSLELFLTDVLQQVSLLCKVKNLNKATPQILKSVIIKSKYDFMKEAVDELPDLDETNPKQKSKAGRKKKNNRNDSPRVGKKSKKIKKNEREKSECCDSEDEDNSD